MVILVIMLNSSVNVIVAFTNFLKPQSAIEVKLAMGG